MEEWERRRRAARAEAHAALNAVAALREVDYLDAAALTDGLLGATETERKSVSGSLQLLFNDTWRTQHREQLDLLAIAQAWHAMMVGTSAPSRNDFQPHGPRESLQRAATPARLGELWAARPKTARDRMIRWWWEEPRIESPALWVVWRELVLSGEIAEPHSERYALGALHHLEMVLPQNFVDGRVHVPEVAGLAALHAYIASDPGIVDLARKAVALENDSAWVAPERRLLLVAGGVLERAPVVADSLPRLTRTLGRDVASSRRQLIDALAPDPALLAPHTHAVTRVVAAGEPADQAWAIGRLAQMQKAGRLGAVPELADALEVAVPQVAVDAAKRALALAKTLGAGAENRVAVVALSHAKLAVQQAAWRVFERQSPEDVGAEIVAGVEASGPTLLPAVASRASAWLGAIEGRSAAAPAPPLAIVPLERVDPIAELPLDDDVVALVARVSTRSAEPLDLDHLLAIVAAKPASALAVERAEIARRVRQTEPLGIAFGALPGHAAEAVMAWVAGSIPAALPHVKASRRLLGAPHMKYSSNEVSAGAAFATGWRAEHSLTHCAHIGVTGLWCSRAWEAAFAGVAGPGTLLATPTHSSGSVSAAALAARLPQAVPGPLRYDAIALVLRLEPSCHDESVLNAVRASHHPAAVAALALWGHLRESAVADWLQPALRSRARDAGHGEVRETRYPKMRNYHPSSYRDSGPVLEWSPAPAELHVADPLGGLAFQRGTHGISGRLLEFAALDLRGLIDGNGAAEFGSPFRVAPWNTDEVAASFASWMVRDDAPARAWTPMDEWVSPLLRLPIVPGPGWTALIAAALLHGNTGVRASAVDALGAGVGLDPAAIGSMIARLIAAGSPGTARAADALRDCAHAGPDVANVAAQALVGAVAGGAAQQRDGARLLEALEVAVAGAGSTVSIERARSALTAAAAGTSRRAASAKRLLAL